MLKATGVEPRPTGSVNRRKILRPVQARFRRLGIQTRIMLYVVFGLVVMFGLLIFIGLRSVNQATELNFDERLSTARTFSIILERDLLHVSADIWGNSAGLLKANEESQLESVTEDLLHHIGSTDSFALFHAARICVIGSDGQLLASASDLPPHAEAGGCGAEGSDQTLPDEYDAFVPTAVLASDGGLGAVITRIGTSSDEPNWVIIDLIAHNSPEALGPALYRATSDGLTEASDDRTGFSHLEVFGPDGIVVLGIGDDEQPGEISNHFAAVQQEDIHDTAVVLEHRTPSGDGDHVAAVVPVSNSDFTMVLEQPIDVALALPLRLQRDLFLWSGVGFLGALLVAWVTTRSIVKPTEELTAAARRMADGNLDSPVAVSAHAEVGILAESLESMRQQTQAAHTALAEAKADLELRVEERTARLGVLLDALITAQEDERHRIARELHDETAQTIGALTIALDRTRGSLNGESADARQHIAQAKDIATHLLAETRRLILDLRPMVLDDMGLTAAIRWYADARLESEGITTKLDVDVPDTRLPQHLETALFRIVQEAINNIAKHSRANTAHIELSFLGPSARIVVSDDGDGFDAPDKLLQPGIGGGFGLAGMRERVSLLAGEFAIRSGIAKGTVLEVEVPIPVGAR